LFQVVFLRTEVSNCLHPYLHSLHLTRDATYSSIDCCLGAFEFLVIL
jgi:hypothetical protein